MQVDPSIAIGLGIILSLFFTETLGVTAGGLIVPGYIALYLQDPPMVIGTFTISILTYFIVQSLSRIILIYGKRRLVLSLLIGFLLGYIVRNELIFEKIFSYLASHEIHGDKSVIGYIIPGLVASWMDRQGVVRTISVIFITASIVHLILMLLYKGEFYV